MFKEIKNPNVCQLPQRHISAQLSNLMRKVQRAISENKKIHGQILSMDLNFSYKLYQPIKYQGIDEMFLKPLILRQIDQLQEQKQTLLTKKQVLNLIINEDNKKKQNEIASTATHYSFLRSTWTKIQTQTSDSFQRMDNLSKVVGVIRNNIKQITEQEQKFIDKQINNQKNKNLFIDSIFQQKQRQQFQKLRMRNEELETKCFELQQIIEEKNKKIDILQSELYHAGNRIKQSINTLNMTSQKLINLKKSKTSLQGEIRRLQNNSSHQVTCLTFNTSSDDYKIKVYSSAIIQMTVQDTGRTLTEVLEFFRSNHSLNCTTKQDTEHNLQGKLLQLPSLNLDQTQSTSETAFTDRYFSKIPKFIPMRTQRSCLMKSQQFKRINSSQTGGEQNEEQSGQQTNDNTLKRFIRKGQFPLTSDRFRKNVTFTDQTLLDQSQNLAI